LESNIVKQSWYREGLCCIDVGFRPSGRCVFFEVLVVVFWTAFGRYHSVVDYHSVPAKREEEGEVVIIVWWGVQDPVSQYGAA